MARRALILLGPPGAGKGTQGRRLMAHLGYPSISTGDALRAEIEKQSDLGNAARKLMEAGELVPDSLVNEIVQARLTEPDSRQRIYPGRLSAHRSARPSFWRNLPPGKASNLLPSASGWTTRFWWRGCHGAGTARNAAGYTAGIRMPASIRDVVTTAAPNWISARTIGRKWSGSACRSITRRRGR